MLMLLHNPKILTIKEMLPTTITMKAKIRINGMISLGSSELSGSLK